MSVVEATGPIKFAKIDGAVGDNTIVAAVSGKKIRVLAVYLRQSAAGTAIFESDDGDSTQTALTGTIPTTTADLHIVAAFSPVGHFETLTGELLNLALGTATADGWIVYQEVL